MEEWSENGEVKVHKQFSLVPILFGCFMRPFPECSACLGEWKWKWKCERNCVMHCYGKIEATNDSRRFQGGLAWLIYAEQCKYDHLMEWNGSVNWLVLLSVRLPVFQQFTNIFSSAHLHSSSSLHFYIVSILFVMFSPSFSTRLPPVFQPFCLQPMSPLLLQTL